MQKSAPARGHPKTVNEPKDMRERAIRHLPLKCPPPQAESISTDLKSKVKPDNRQVALVLECLFHHEYEGARISILKPWLAQSSP
jgi:hypothetical protein